MPVAGGAHGGALFDTRGDPARGVLPLTEICKRHLIRRIATVKSTETAPLHLLKEILSRVPVAKQLREIELNSPQVLDITEDLWKRFIVRDFPDADLDKYVPGSSHSWYRCYAKHQAEHNRKEKELEDKLRLQMNALHAQKDAKKMVLLNKTPYIPRSARMGSSGHRVQPTDPNIREHWNSAAGSKTKNVMLKIKREIAEKKIFTKPKLQSHVRQPYISNDLKQKLIASAATDPPPPQDSRGNKRKFSPGFADSDRPSMSGGAGRSRYDADPSSSSRKRTAYSPPPPSQRANVSSFSNISTAISPDRSKPILVRKPKEANVFLPSKRR